jgi:hypothetical protein
MYLFVRGSPSARFWHASLFCHFLLAMIQHFFLQKYILQGLTSVVTLQTQQVDEGARSRHVGTFIRPHARSLAHTLTHLLQLLSSTPSLLITRGDESSVSLSVSLWPEDSEVYDVTGDICCSANRDKYSL